MAAASSPNLKRAIMPHKPPIGRSLKCSNSPSELGWHSRACLARPLSSDRVKIEPSLFTTPPWVNVKPVLDKSLHHISLVPHRIITQSRPHFISSGTLGLNRSPNPQSDGLCIFLPCCGSSFSCSMPLFSKSDNAPTCMPRWGVHVSATDTRNAVYGLADCLIVSACLEPLMPHYSGAQALYLPRRAA